MVRHGEGEAAHDGMTVTGGDGSTAELPVEGRHASLSRSLSGTNLARAGDYNLRTVLQAIRLQPDTTRVALSTQTGLTPPTIANITHRLAELGLVKISGRRHGRRGQPALKLQVEADGAFGIGLNVDRDHLSLVTLDLAGRVRSRVTREIAFALPDDVLRFLADERDDAIAAGGIDRDRILGVGVAIPDELGSIALPGRPAGYGIWTQVNLVAMLSPVLPWPIHCDNDAASAALGEAEYGTGFRNPTFVYLLVSAGLGGAIVVDRRFHRGATRRSGEIGLMPDTSTDRPGAVVQDVVSLSAILDRLTKAQGTPASIEDVASPNVLTAAVLKTWIDDAVRALSTPLTAIACLLDADAVLIGGRLPLELITALADALSAALASLALPSRPKVIPAAMAQDAPALGAAILPFLDHLLPSDAILIQAGR
jgi:predicted NBD/HSP70 family sugar kinase